MKWSYPKNKKYKLNITMLSGYTRDIFIFWIGESFYVYRF